MPVQFVSGDPLLTQAQTLAFATNAKGRTEVSSLETALRSRYPAAFSTYNKACRSGRIAAGTTWLWSQSSPQLLFFAAKESPVGATRLRHVQSVVLALARDYQLDGIASLAIAPFGRDHEWLEIRRLLMSGFSASVLPVIVYETYQPGIQVSECA